MNLGHIDEVAALFRYGKITSEGRTTVHEGPREIADWYRESVSFPEKLPDTLLFTSNIQIDIDNDDASAKAYFVAMHQTSGGVAPVIAGRYQDRFRRVEGDGGSSTDT